jgi:hypothetical protein
MFTLMFAYVFICLRSCFYTYLHISKQKNVTHMFTYAFKHMYTHMFTHMFKHIFTQMFTHMFSLISTQIIILMFTHLFTLMFHVFTHIFTIMFTFISTYMFTHIFTTQLIIHSFLPGFSRFYNHLSFFYSVLCFPFSFQEFLKFFLVFKFFQCFQNLLKDILLRNLLHKFVLVHSRSPT